MSTAREFHKLNEQRMRLSDQGNLKSLSECVFRLAEIRLEHLPEHLSKLDYSEEAEQYDKSLQITDEVIIDSINTSQQAYECESDKITAGTFAKSLALKGRLNTFAYARHFVDSRGSFVNSELLYVGRRHFEEIRDRDLPVGLKDKAVIDLYSARLEKIAGKDAEARNLRIGSVAERWLKLGQLDMKLAIATKLGPLALMHSYHQP